MVLNLCETILPGWAGLTYKIIVDLLPVHGGEGAAHLIAVPLALVPDTQKREMNKETAARNLKTLSSQVVVKTHP